jgi:hypothetical protein
MLLSMVEKRELIPNYQFCYRQRQSTIEQTYRIMRRINEALKIKRYSSAAF